MATTQTLPASIVAGTTVKFTLDAPDYPSPTWTVQLQVAGASVLRVNGGNGGSGLHSFTLSATDTGGLLPGSYTYRLVASSGGEVYVAESGTFEVERNLAAAGEGDAQAFAEKALALVEARLLGRYTEDMESFTIGNRTVTQIPVDELLTTRDRLREELRALARGAAAFDRPVRVWFTGPGAES